MIKITKKIFLNLILVFSLFFSSFLLNSCAGEESGEYSTRIDNGTLIIQSQQTVICINMTTDGLIHVDAYRVDGEEVETDFFIKRETDTQAVTASGKGFLIGSYFVVPRTDGYTLSLDGQVLYESDFSPYIDGLKEVKNVGDGKAFFGMGQSSKKLNLSGENFTIYHTSQFGDQTYMYIPFFFTQEGDGFYQNASPKDIIRFRSSNKGEATLITETGGFDYYYKHTESPIQLVSWFYDFSQSKSLLPKWAYGFIQSKFGYKNQQEVYDLVEEFETRDIPVSAIVLDLYWFDHMGDLNWDYDAWPNPQELVKFLEDRGIKLITISEPYVTNLSNNYERFKEGGLLGEDGEGGISTWNDWFCFDAQYGAIMNPMAENADELWGQTYVKMMADGIDAFWTDLGEPERVPSNTTLNSYDELAFHNYYNREWSRMISENIAEAYPDRRLFILSRSGYTGSAGYGVSNWSGDVPCSWNGLAFQIPLGLNAGLSGFSFWGSDVGGFDGMPDEELFIRWYQFGLYTPVFRAHGNQEREPWIYSADTDDILRDVINERYALLPYIYSTAYQTYRDGIPMMRPLFLNHPEDEEALSIKTEYYFGDSLLIAPIITPASSGKHRVYLPEGHWYDKRDMTMLEGGWHEMIYGIDEIPVFYKEGAIIPMAQPEGDMELLLIPSEEPSSFILYLDDGESNAFRQGEYEEIVIDLSMDSLSVSDLKEQRTFNLKIYKDGEWEELEVTLGPGEQSLSL